MSQKPMTIVIADDDPVFREYLRLILSPMTDVHIAAVFEDAFETLKYLQTNAVDLALLDVEMPGLTGLELARSLQVKPMFMFITSHPGYALEGFDVEAIDYILKPIQKERVYKAIQKAQQLMQLKQAAAAPLPAAAGTDDGAFIFVKEKNDYIKLDLAHIVYVEALSDFVQIHLQNGQKHLVLVNLKNLEPQLKADYFLRISRTHLINIRRVTALRNHHIELEPDGVSLPIGKSYLDAVEDTLLKDRTIRRFAD